MKRTAAIAALLLFACVLACARAYAAETAFSPVPQGTVNIAATTTTARVQFQTSAVNKHVRIFNAGTVAAFVACGDANVTASTTTSMPIGGGAAAIIFCPQQYIAAITSTTATVYVTPGNGGGAQ